MHDRSCSRYSEIEDLLRTGRGIPPDWEDHLARCPECRAEAALSSELRAALAPTPVPALAPGFEARLRRRLEQSAAGAARRRDRWIMAAYWAAAVAASLVILARLDWQPWTSGSAARWPGLLTLAVLGPLLAAPDFWRLLSNVGHLMWPGGRHRPPSGQQATARPGT